MGRWNPEWHVYIDAALGKDGSRVGVGLVVWDGHGRLLWGEGGVTYGAMTSNEAEYAALVWALARLARTCRSRAPMPRLVIYLDSTVVVDQMRGQVSVRHNALRRWHRHAQSWVRRFPSVTFMQIPRKDNRLADALARIALEIA